MILTVFRNRLKPEGMEEYFATAERISALAETMPGYLSHKTFTAEDGERVTIVEFDSEENQHNWAVDMEHAEAKRRGRAAFYSEYSIQVCKVMRESRFSAD